MARSVPDEGQGPARNQAEKQAEKQAENQAGDARVDRDELEGFEPGLAPAGVIELAAARWATRRQAPLDPADETGLRDWLAKDPAHAAALARNEASLHRVRQLPDSEIRRLRAGLPARTADPGSQQPMRQQLAVPAPARFRIRWAPALVGAIAASVLVVSGWLGWQAWLQQPLLVAEYHTARGQRLPVELPDGSRLLLDAASSIEVRLFRDRRVVRQLSGQAMYSVAPRPGQPFEVVAGGVRVEVVGTRFEVRHGGSDGHPGPVEVAVEAGRVRVGADAPSIIELGAGQAVVADATGRLASPHSVAAGAVAPWRRGRIEFDDTPLVEALAELERYGDTGLVIRDPDVAAMRLGGSFDLTRLATFAQALPVLLPVRLAPHDGKTEIVKRP